MPTTAVEPEQQSQLYSHGETGTAASSSGGICALGDISWLSPGGMRQCWIQRCCSPSPAVLCPCSAQVTPVWALQLGWTRTTLSWSKPQSLFVFAVMNDIITTMFNKKFMEELFKPQDLYSKKALRTVYDRLAHASIMRLNQASMDKVTQSCLCCSPQLPCTSCCCNN